ncbi:MAG: hypothetical protein JW892_17930 [Anaerolineae bacterium]|nr:hypothetical protein [Anaerolineae bacterium]
MNKFLPLAMVIVGGLLLAPGLLFLCAAIQEPKRLLLSLLLLVGGGLLAFFGGRLWARDRALSPVRLAGRITELVGASDAETTVAQAVASLGAPHAAVQAAFDLLQERGEAYREKREDKEVYVFPGLMPSKVVRRCPYCGNSFSVKTPVHKCPYCGGVVEIERE